MAGLGRRDAMVGDREVMSADQAVVLIRRRAVRNQAEQARATSTMLVERCLRAVAQSLAVCGEAAEGYADARNARQVAADRRRAATTGQDGTPILDGFQVQGLIDGQPVGATLTRGRLICDPALRARAELLVDLQEEVSDEEGRLRYVASLEGPDVAVALTLLRACDRWPGSASASPCRRLPTDQTRPTPPRRDPILSSHRPCHLRAIPSSTPPVRRGQPRTLPSL